MPKKKMEWNVRVLINKLHKLGFNPPTAMTRAIYRRIVGRGKQRGRLSYFEIVQLNDWLEETQAKS